jgi:hypothetical protein
MNIHFLAGDSLLKPFQKTGIEGEVLICRECFADGDLKADDLTGFWKIREEYLDRYPTKEPGFYQNKVKKEFEKLRNNDPEVEINLWFEYELFCQVNLWFCLNLLNKQNKKIYIVYPKFENKEEIWNGFSYLDETGLQGSFAERICLTEDDISLGSNLWETFAKKNSKGLLNLSQNTSEAFPSLKRIGKAAAEIENEPPKIINQLIKKEGNDFGKVFQAFNREFPIYGFGDLQVKKFFDELIS